VKDVTLYTTTVIYGATNEVATISNGSLALSRIINAARSPKASMIFFLKFPIDTPYEKLQVFRSALEKFVKHRPRDVSLRTCLCSSPLLPRRAGLFTNVFYGSFLLSSSSLV